MVADRETDRKAEDERIRFSLAMSDAYAYLALFLQFPTRDMFSGLSEGSIRYDIGGIFDELGIIDSRKTESFRLLNNIDAEIISGALSFEDLRKDYTRLFNHPVRPAIAFYEGLFLAMEDGNPAGRKPLPRLFINPAALDAERCYRRAGLVRASDMKIPADCMATEMEFMQYIYLERARFLQESKREKLAHIEDVHEEFSKLHLEKWMKRFFESLFGRSRCGLYRLTAQIGGILSDIEYERLRDR